MTTSMTPTEIKQKRKAMGLTQQALADLLGVDRSTVIRWEKSEDTSRHIRPAPYLALALQALDQARAQTEAS